MAAFDRPSATPREWLPTLRRYLGLMAIASLAWEIAHVPLYTLWQEAAWPTIVWAVFHCTAGDIAIAGAAMLAALLLFGSSDWPAGGPWRVVIAATVIGAAYTIYSEWLNVEIRGNWAYAAAMPRLPVLGTGLTPFLQWLLLPPLCFVAAARLGSSVRASAESVRLRST